MKQLYPISLISEKIITLQTTMLLFYGITEEAGDIKIKIQTYQKLYLTTGVIQVIELTDYQFIFHYIQ